MELQLLMNVFCLIQQSVDYVVDYIKNFLNFFDGAKVFDDHRVRKFERLTNLVLAEFFGSHFKSFAKRAISCLLSYLFPR